MMSFRNCCGSIFNWFSSEFRLGVELVLEELVVADGTLLLLPFAAGSRLPGELFGCSACSIDASSVWELLLWLELTPFKAL